MTAQGWFTRRTAAAALAVLLAAGLPIGAGGAQAQTSATVTVTAGTSLATIPPAAFGLNSAVWDGDLLDSGVAGLLTNAGIVALRYPGGSTADIYNWQSNAIVPNGNSYANPNNDFDAWMGLVKKTGVTPIITVNYGTNTAGNGGGTPSFAASWVQYANVTKGYGVKYWEIGNEVYGNGEYGGAFETDMHSAHDPTTYGTNVAQFASAMKAVDSTIKVGVVLTAPGNFPDGQSPNWNTNVLAQCGSAIDFVIVHWYPQNPGNESDSGLLAAPQNGFSGSPGIASMVKTVRGLINQYAGANAANVQILVTETNSVSSNPGKQTISTVNAMFIADDVTTWIENGVASVEVWTLHDSSTNGNSSSSLFGSSSFGDYGILSNATNAEPAADTPFATYYGLQMLSHLGKPGDTLVSATTSTALLSAHAVKQANGNLSLLLINKDPSNATSATISLSGFTPASGANVFSFGKSSSAITSSTLSGAGSSFTVSVPSYSLTTIVLSPGTATPGFSLTDTPGSLSLVQGGSSGSASIGVAPSGGFSGTVAFAASGLPSGVTASFGAASSTGSTTLTLSAASSAAAGTSIVTITGTSGQISAKTTLSLTVSAPQTPGYSLSASPSSLSVTAGSSTSTTLSVAPSGGFTGSVALAASGLPSGVTASFSAASTTGTSTLTLAAASSAAAGSATITVTGTSGSTSHSVSIPVTVAAAPPPSSPPPSSPPPSSGSAGPATFTAKVGSNSNYFDEDDLVLASTGTITALTVTITAAAGNVTFNGMYNTIGSQIVGSHATSGSNLVYSFTLASGQTFGAGNFTFAAQMSGNGTAHPATGDSWSVTYTQGGTSYTQSGKF